MTPAEEVNMVIAAARAHIDACAEMMGSCTSVPGRQLAAVAGGAAEAALATMQAMLERALAERGLTPDASESEP